MSAILAGLSRARAPRWASGYGEDEYGPFIDFTFGSGSTSTSQRLRWIPPGTFLMGSPESEEGRFEREGPQHEVRLTQGFWLFDKPCRQSLYETLMGANPSEFKDRERPVENVNWHDANAFCEKLESLLSGVSVRLPTEAEWEYACRAGSTTAIYMGDLKNMGDLKIIGENNAPALGPIAWYGGNSGKDFDLEKGRNSNSWPNKQNPHIESGKRRVGLKAPNPWGLYDMLGNVWEWCLDGPSEISRAPATDPREPVEADASRVSRGGSWNVVARHGRSPFRVWYELGKRSSNVGFRCALVQDVTQANRPGFGAERTEPVSGRDATKRRARK